MAQTESQTLSRWAGALVDYAHAKGLLFGLYSEDEGGRDGFTSPPPGCTIGPWKESRVGREHPEWFAGNVLKLGIPAAAAYWEKEVRQILEHYRLDLYRHDFNGCYLKDTTKEKP